MRRAIRGWSTAGVLAISMFSCSAVVLGAAPFQLQRMGNWPGYSRGPTLDVQVVGTRVFLALDYGGLAILDVSNLKEPTRLTGYDTPGYAVSVQVVGEHAYLADSGGIEIFHIGTGTPQLVATNIFSDGVWNVYVSGQYLYAMGSYLRILDVANPASPQLVYEALVNPWHGGVVDVRFSNNRLFVLDADHFLGRSHLNIYDGAVPFSFPPGTLELDGIASEFQVSGDYAYLAGSFGLQIYNVSDPANIVLAGSDSSGGAARGLLVEGSYCYVANTLGLQVIYIANPQTPSARGSISTGGAAFQLSKAGIYVYVADVNVGLQIINVGNPGSLSRVGGYFTAGSVAEVKRFGDYACLASIQAGLEIVDVRNDNELMLVGQYRTAGIARGLDVAGQFAYVAANDSGLQIINISDPARPILARTVPVENGEYITDVTIQGDVAYALRQYRGIQVFDISVATNPVHITTISNVNRGNVPNSFHIEGTHGFLADGALGLRIFDLNVPTNPIPLGSWTNQWYTRDVAVSGHYALMVGDRGVYVLDVCDPLNPQPVGSYDTERLANGIAVSGSTAYVACVSGGLKVLDISNPASPLLVLTTLIGESVSDVTVEGNRIYVAQGPVGLSLLAQITPGRMDGMRASPGFAEMTVSGTAGFPLKIEATTDLGSALSTSWTVLFQTNCPTTPFIFRDTHTSPNQRFYRVRQP